MGIKSLFSGIKKYYNSDETEGGLWRIISGNDYSANLNPVNLISYNKSWVNICNSKNASVCASIPLKLYYHNKTGKKLQATSYKDLTDIKTIAQIAKELKISLKKQSNIVEITEHPVLELFDNINPVLNYYDFTEIIQQYLGLIGNAYVEIVRDSSGMPVELLPLLSEYVSPYATGTNEGQILYYNYTPGKVARKYNPDQILHFAQYEPGNLLIGKGRLEKCFSAAERYRYYDAYENQLGANSAQPGVLVDFKGKLSEADMKSVKRQFDKEYGGLKNSGGTIVTSGGVELKPLSLTIKDMQYEKGRISSRDEIAAAFGVPKSLITSDDVNLANSVSGMNQYLKNTIYPLMVKYCSKINEQLMPLYDQDLYMWFENQYIEDPAIKTKSTIDLFTAGIITLEEARNMQDLEATSKE